MQSVPPQSRLNKLYKQFSISIEVVQEDVFTEFVNIAISTTIFFSSDSHFKRLRSKASARNREVQLIFPLKLHAFQFA